MLFFFIVSSLISCDPGFSIVVSNNSNAGKKVKVINSDKYFLPDSNFLEISNLLKGDFYVSGSENARIPLLAKDTIEYSYSFFLDSGKTALLKAGTGGPDLSQRIITMDYDTIYFRKDQRVQLKKKFLFSTLKFHIL